MDNNTNNYMLLQQRNVRIPLLAKNGTWKFTINKEKWEIPNCMELLYAYHLIGNQDYRTTSETLRANYKHISPIQIEAFIQHFEKTHPIEEYQFDITSLPQYTKSNTTLCVPNPFSYTVLLTMKQEQELLDILKQENSNRKWLICNWFEDYLIRYGLAPYDLEDIRNHRNELATVFCQLHGIDFNKLRRKQDVEKQKKSEEELKVQVSDTEVFLATLLHTAIGIGLFLLVEYLIAVQLFGLSLSNEASATYRAICMLIAIAWNIWFHWNARHLWRPKITYENPSEHFTAIQIDCVCLIPYAIICFLILTVGQVTLSMFVFT